MDHTNCAQPYGQRMLRDSRQVELTWSPSSQLWLLPRQMLCSRGVRIFSFWILGRIWCWFVHTRVAKGIWRKSGDRPEGVDWHERVIDVCEGGWTYVAGATGYAPSKFRSVFEIRAGVLELQIINDVSVTYNSIIQLFLQGRRRWSYDRWWPFSNCRCCCWFVDRQNCRKCNSICGWAWALQIELAPEQWLHVGHLQALPRWPRLGTKPWVHSHWFLH